MWICNSCGSCLLAVYGVRVIVIGLFAMFGYIVTLTGFIAIYGLQATAMCLLAAINELLVIVNGLTDNDMHGLIAIVMG